MGYTEEPWVPQGENLPLKEVVQQAIGSASMCWSNVRGAGVFDDQRAAWVADGLNAYLQRAVSDVLTGTTEAVQDDEPRLGLASTEDLLLELAARFGIARMHAERSHVQEMHKGLTPEQLAYRPA